MLGFRGIAAGQADHGQVGGGAQGRLAAPQLPGQVKALAIEPAPLRHAAAAGGQQGQRLGDLDAPGHRVQPGGGGVHRIEPGQGLLGMRGGHVFLALLPGQRRQVPQQLDLDLGQAGTPGLWQGGLRHLPGLLDLAPLVEPEEGGAGGGGLLALVVGQREQGLFGAIEGRQVQDLRVVLGCAQPGVEGRAALAMVLQDAGALLGQLRRFAQAPQLGGLGAGARQPGSGLQGLPGGQPMPGHPCGLALVLGQQGGHLGLQRLGDRLGQRFTRGLGDQVVGKAFALEHLRGLQLGPGIGQGQRVLVQQLGHPRGRAVLPQHRHAAHHLPGGRAQPCQAQLDQALHGGGQRPGCRRRGWVGQGLERLQHEQRVAAGVAVQGAGVRRAGPGRRADRADQALHGLDIQRGQRQHLGAGRLLQGLHPGQQRGLAFARPQRQQPGTASAVGQALQQLDAGAVGVVQVVQQQRRQALGDGRVQQLLGRRADARGGVRWRRRCGASGAIGPFGQQAGQRRARPGLGWQSAV